MAWDNADNDDDSMAMADGENLDNNRITSQLHDELNSEDQRQELEFLATMTFANGGLRAPSCPCCE